MFFRNLCLFQFSAGTAAALAELDLVLSDNRLRPCGPIEMHTSGMVSPFGGESDHLVLRTGDFALIAVGSEDKLLPSSVINAELQARLQAVASQEARRVGAKERRRMKDEIITDLVPRAFVRPSRTFAYLDLRDGWLVIDSASRKSAENVVTQIREAAGRFPATPLAPEEHPRAVLTDWLTTGQLPCNLVLGDQCDLIDPAEGGAAVRCRRQDLELDEIKEHLQAGKMVERLGLEFDGRISFVLGADLTIRTLRFLDVVHDEIDEASLESSEAELQATFVLMTLEVRRLLDAMAQWFGLYRPLDQA